MSWIDAELVIVSIAAMVNPTTLLFSVLALALSRRPLYTGFWFYLGALLATLAIGVLAAVVLGNYAASHHPSTPKTWVAILDLILGVLLIVWVVRWLRRPVNKESQEKTIEKGRNIASSAWVALLAAGAAGANPGFFIPIALKTISETDPSTGRYFVLWTAFTVASLLPLGVAMILLLVSKEWAERLLDRVRGWLLLHVRTIAAVIIIALAASLLRGGIAGLT